MSTSRSIHTYGGKRVKWLKGGDVIQTGDVEWQCSVSITCADADNPTKEEIERGKALLKSTAWGLEPVGKRLIGLTVKSTQERGITARMFARPQN